MQDEEDSYFTHTSQFINKDEENAKKLRKHGLLISPESILFLDTFPGEEYKSKIMLQNISINKIVIRITKPYSLNFQVNDDGSPVFLSPGLSLLRVVTFKCTHEKVKDTHLPVWINNRCFEVPIRVKHGEACLSVSPTRLNFGTIDLGARCVSRYLFLTNTGAGSSKFSIDLGQNRLDIVAAPKKGTLMPYSSVRVKLDLAAFVTGEHSTEFWVKGSPPTMIYVEVSVLMPFLQAVHPNTTARFTLIDFQPTYFGTVRYETLIVRNMSSVSSSYVVLAEINNELMTVDELQEKYKEEAINYHCFSVEPLEGTLGPFESRIFTVWFHPVAEEPDKGWAHEQPMEREYLCFLRVFKVSVSDWKDTKENKLPSKLDINDEEGDALNLRLCLHGSGQKPRIGVLTSSFTFTPVTEGEKLVRVVHVKNLKDLPIFCKFEKSPGFQVSPPEMKISGMKSVEMTLFFRVTSLGTSNKHLVFNILSYKDLTNGRGKVLIGQLKIPVEIGVLALTRKPEPNFVMGITPIVAHEVGVHTDSIKFNDPIEKPKGVCFPKSSRNCPWLESDDYIAFPNDMTKSFRVKETDKIKRSIFTGKARYIPPVDRENTFTEAEVKSIKIHENHYSKFLCKISMAKLNYILSKDDKDYCWRKSPSEIRLYKHMGMEPLLEKSKTMQKKAFSFTFQETFYPLTPRNLYNVRIMPKKLDFGQIPPYVDCTRTVAVENMNHFPVSIFLHVQKDPSNINDAHFVVGPKQRIEKLITLNLNSFGKYYSNVSFVVNYNDCFDMTLVAEVVRRALSIVPNEIIMNSKYNSDDIFQINWVPVRLVNKLYVPTSFEWRIPIDSRFKIVPSSGVVPGQRAICCAIHFESAFESYSSASLDLVVIGGELAQLKIIRFQDTAHNVNVLLQKKIFPPLSVNLKFVDAALLFNHGFKDAIFNVLNPNPLDGINISPIVGKIPGKSCVGISIDIQLNSVLAFDFNLQIKIQFKNSIEVKYVGFVFFPKVKFSPKKLELQNIPCNSLTTYLLKAENYGQSAAQVNFLLEGYPQIKLSDNKKHSMAGYDDHEGFTLQAGNSKEFYLHFMPYDFATYELLLPVLLNQTIGPPKIHHDESQSPMTYIKPTERVNRILKNIDLSLPPKLTSMRIDCSIGRGFISFSTFKLNFLVPDKFCSQRKRLTLRNLTNDICHVFLDIKQLFSSYFYFLNLPKDGWIEIAPRQDIVLQVVFSPSYPDTWEVEIPVYVKEYNQTIPYNYINLVGLLHKSTLTCEQAFVQFLPVPVGISAERCLEIVATHQFNETKLSHHFKKILGEHDELSIEVSYPKGNKIPNYLLKQSPTIINVCLKFKSKKVVSHRGTLIFTDELDGACEILFTACADNSLMSCYKYLSICRHVTLKKGKVKCHKFFKSDDDQGENYSFRFGDYIESDMDPDIAQEILDFPMFPSTTSETSYAESMRSVVRTMENWLYEQGFSGSFRMVIGEHIAFSKGFISAQNSRAKNPNQACIKSIIDLLFIFVGRDLFLEYQLPTSVPEDNSERIEYALGVYKQVLKFIKVQGGNVSHIFPVYLLPYDDYYDHLKDLNKKSFDQKRKALHYQDIFEEKFSKKKLLPQEAFERFNKQAWLDVFLQMHRVVVQARIPFMKELQKCLNSKNINSEFFNQDALTDSESSVAVYRTVEKGDKILIDWLNLVYLQVKLRNPELNLPNRVISDFGEDLEDAVVLSAVTIFYCPYLIDDYFGDFFFNPSDQNQAHHNSTLLCIAWTTIRLGLTVTPEDFFMNPVFMTMLVTHLYSVLQSYIPQRSIEFLACLTSFVTRKISLINPNEKPIGYSVKIVGDQNNSFTIDKSRPMVMVSPKSVTPISITFSAKKLYPTKATMLLCGHCIPNGYVENIVLTLHGDPFNLVVSRDYTVNTPVMKPTFIVANISSPYDVEAEYDLWYTEKEPKPGELNIRPWSEVKTAKLPRSLFLSCDQLTVPPATAVRPAPLSITAACFTRTVLHFWIILRNDEVGDFIIRVILKPKLVTPSVILRVPLPTGLCSGYQGTTLCSSRCPRLISVHLPSRNTRLWTTVKTMLALTLQPKELSFWEKHYETRIGLDLMKWLLGKDANSLAKEINFIFDSKITYKVTSMSPHLQVQETLQIEDIHSYEFSDLMVHLCCWVQSEFCVDVLLESESGQEVRLYRLKFYGTAPLGNVISSCKKSCSGTRPAIEGPCEYSEDQLKGVQRGSAGSKKNTKISFHK